MKLRHFSAQKIPKVLQRFSYREQKVAYKPIGFWVSDEDEHGWKDWCEGEQWGLSRLTREYEVVLADKANVLYINSLRQLDEFREAYMASLYPDVEGLSGIVDGIDWSKVAQKYDGIIISPYFYQRRFATGFMWYYGWDCASGCIWNVRAIKEVREVRNGETRRVRKSD